MVNKGNVKVNIAIVVFKIFVIYWGGWLFE